MSSKFHFVLVIHAHQPPGNFDHVFEQCYERCYLPFVQALDQYPGVHLGLHYSGPLLQWIEAHHPEYFDLLNKLVKRGQVEMVGGGFYEPILISIPAADQHEQITRLADYLQNHFGERPGGLWLTERVWEPQLPSALSNAGVQYTLVDDIHFQAAGFEPHEMFADYVAEDGGHTVRVIPGQKVIRYLVPFAPVEQVLGYLKESVQTHPGGLAAMGDDMEKFGVWPGTFAHCYQDGEGWVKRFFRALEENSSWLQVATPKEYLATHQPKGRADLPTASYTEMMEWSLPTPVRQRFSALLGEFHGRSDVLAFLRGGTWRGFFRKYPESSLLHKKMLRVSRRLAAAERSRRGAQAGRELAEARDLLLRSQCNDTFWHGVFGGLYAPHLRTVPWRDLIRAEAIVDQHIANGKKPRVETFDYDGDGVEELLFTSREAQALLKPSDGATLATLDFRPTNSAVINSMQRRLEAYHARLKEISQQQVTHTGVASIHEQTRVKEPGLGRFLLYDRWAKHMFRLLVFDASRSQVEYERLELQEDAGVAGGNYRVVRAEAHCAECRREGPLANQALRQNVSVTKAFSLHSTPQGCEVICNVELSVAAPLENPIAVGIESVINLLAPNEPDRFISTPSGPQNLRYSGTVPGSGLSLEDGWQRLRVFLHAPDAEHFWISSIETVSESEDGFERVYQGSQILAVWKPDFSERRSWMGQLVLRLEAF